MMTGRIAVNHIFNAKRMAIHGKIKANQTTSMQIKLRQCKSNYVNANQMTSMQWFCKSNGILNDYFQCKNAV